jgi:hypothetical protein
MGDLVAFLKSLSPWPAGRGEPVVREDNYCEIDPNVVDKYGIPVLKFNVKFSEHEVKQAKHMKETFREMMHNMGAIIIIVFFCFSFFLSLKRL